MVKCVKRERMFPVGLLTECDLVKFGPSFVRAYPIDENPCFEDLLASIDQADRDLSRVRKKVE